MPGNLSCTAPSSPSPTENSGRGRLRIRNRWTSTTRKPDLNRSLTTGPDTSPVIANTDTARKNPHPTPSDYTHLADMPVIVRHQDTRHNAAMRESRRRRNPERDILCAEDSPSAHLLVGTESAIRRGAEPVPR